jgi:hypothetical protein
MKLFHLTLTLTLSLSLVWSLLPSTSRASEYWRFETDEGVASFVDDVKKIPEKYRERAVRQESKGLESYARATQASARPVAAAARAAQQEAEAPARPAQAYTRSKEFRWIDGAYGAPGEVYAPVEVVRDANGDVVSVELHDPDTVRVVRGD